MLHPVARVRVRWLSEAEGGRKKPPPGPSYAPNGRIVGFDDYFSIVLRDPKQVSIGDAVEKELELTLLCPDRLPDVASRLKPGTRITIYEGPKHVADAEVFDVYFEKWPSERPVFGAPSVGVPNRQ